jgi:hypothetical protein
MPTKSVLVALALAPVLVLASTNRASAQLAIWEDRAFINLGVGRHSDTPLNSSERSNRWFVDMTTGVRLGPNYGLAFSLAEAWGNSAGLSDRELLAAPLFFYVIPLNERIDIVGLGGPAFGWISYEIDTGTLRETAWGYQAGVDVRLLLTRRLAIGTYLRKNSVKGELAREVAPPFAGWHLISGLRLRF